MNYLLLLLTWILAGCLPAFADEPKQPPSVFIRLDDIQGLFGGQSLVVATDGHLYARKVQPGKASSMTESRFHLKLTDEQVGDLQALIQTSGIQDYKESKGAGVPDEARPRIIITQPRLKRIDVEKWANAKDPRFDVVYQRLLEWVVVAAKVKPYREKEYEARAAFP
jgi:hypothetical protein